MKIALSFLALCFSLSSFALTSGEPAPNFTLMGARGKEVTLAKLKGKIVVLEWFNPGCPFVRKHYDSGNMQALQKKYTGKGVVWLSVNSSADGKQGHLNAGNVKATIEENKSAATDVLLDAKGDVGRLYEAKTTPHMFIVNKDGKLAYQGAIDSNPDVAKESIASAKNYVAEALDEIIAGKKVSRPATVSYGCSVKY